MLYMVTVYLVMMVQCIGGLARFYGQPVMVVGQHRGRSTREKLQHNFGMSNPEGYRKAQRLMSIWQSVLIYLCLPLLTRWVRTQVWVQKNVVKLKQLQRVLAQLSCLKVPVIATVLGEGGSGGALGIGVADRVVMLISQYLFSNFT